MHLILDGVTLTKAPKNLDLRQKHAAQNIRHMCMKKTEKMDPTLLTYNTYGIQLRTKVPLWGGFTRDGTFALRLWTEKPKMKKEEWVQYIPQLKKAAATHGSSELLSDCKHHQWHNHAFDNLTCKLHGCAIHVLQTLRWWSQEIEDVA